jgi:hypothetical protein
VDGGKALLGDLAGTERTQVVGVVVEHLLDQ